MKSEVRAIARRAGLPTAEKKDSQGICFVGKVPLRVFLKEYLKERPGDVLDERGERIGTHRGAHFYTVGQRHGFLIRKRSDAMGPHYIVKKDIAANTLVVAEGRDQKALYRKEIGIGDLHFVRDGARKERADKETLVRARIRHGQPLQSAKLDTRGSQARVEFSVPQPFVAEGQSLVLYDVEGEEVIGGGIIGQG